MNEDITWSELARLPIAKVQDVLLARFVGRDEGTKMGFPPVILTRLATVISEITRNVVQHAGCAGEIQICQVAGGDRTDSVSSYRTKARGSSTRNVIWNMARPALALACLARAAWWIRFTSNRRRARAPPLQWNFGWEKPRHELAMQIGGRFHGVGADQRTGNSERGGISPGVLPLAAKGGPVRLLARTCKTVHTSIMQRLSALSVLGVC